MQYLSRVFNGKLILAIALLVAILLMDALLSYQNTRELHSKSSWVIHTEQVISNLSELVASVANAETALRGYVITGDDSYLVPYKAAVSSIPQIIKSTRELTKDNPAQKPHLDSLQRLLDVKFNAMDKTIALRHANFEAARSYIISDESQKYAQDIRAQVEAMQDIENNLLLAREQRSARSYKIAVISNVLATLIDFAMLGLFIYLLRHNIKERMQHIESLRHQSDWYRTTLASIGDSVIATDADGSVTFLNPEAERMTGWTLSEARNQPLSKIFHVINEVTRQVIERPVAEVFRKGKTATLSTHSLLVSKNGTEHPIVDTVAPIKSANGKMLGAILVFHDMSTYNELRKALQNKTEILIERDRRKDEFLAMLAHELRNPLAPISNALHILESPGINKKTQKEVVDMANHQVSHMTRLLDDLLDVSRIINGKITLQCKQVNLCEIIKTAIESAKPLIDERHHSFEAKIPECPLWAYGDETRLVQLFGNLLNNAAKYTDKGGRITLDVSTENNEVAVCISDNGIGIPADKLPHIFDMFVQIDSSMDRAQGGLGIGLMLVKTIANLHHGDVEVYSAGRGKGAEFTIRLPILQPVRRDIPKQAEESHFKPVSSAYRVLVVDDNQASAKTLGWMVEALGHKVQVAYDAESALKIARIYKPDAVLLDLGMPGMNGYELCMELHKNPELRHTRFIAQTGWGQEQYMQRSKEAGFDSHLIKPISIEALQQQFNAIKQHTQLMLAATMGD